MCAYIACISSCRVVRQAESSGHRLTNQAIGCMSISIRAHATQALLPKDLLLSRGFVAVPGLRNPILSTLATDTTAGGRSVCLHVAREGGKGWGAREREERGRRRMQSACFA
jgi:hypothetical protein